MRVPHARESVPIASLLCIPFGPQLGSLNQAPTINAFKNAVPGLRSQRMKPNIFDSVYSKCWTRLAARNDEAKFLKPKEQEE